MSYFDPNLIRKDFPLIDQFAGVYLDNAATTQKPKQVIDAISQYYCLQNANVHRAAHQLSELATLAFESSRNKVATFINAERIEEIIWTSGTTDSINLVAQSYGLKHCKAGDEIIVSYMEHHANIVPWQLLADRTGAVLKVIPVTESGDLDLDAFLNLLTTRTRIVAITQVSNALGCVNPIDFVIEQAHKAGAIVLIDGAQAVGHFAVDVRALNCDFYAFSGHKMYGPTGIGVLYGRHDLLEAMPPWKAGGEMIEKVSFDGTSFNRPPFRFEAGTPNIAGAIGFGAAIDYLNSLNRTQVEYYEASLLSYAIASLKEIPGLSLIGNPKQQAALVSFELNGFHTYDLGTLLNQQDIAIRTGHHCAMPLMEALKLNEGTARASFAFYNTKAEIDRLTNALCELTSPRFHPVSSDFTPTVEDASRLVNTNTDHSETDAQIQDAEQSQHTEPSHPIEPAHTNTASLIDEFKAKKGWQSRYGFIMKLGKTSPGLADELKTSENQLHGCTAKVWLTHQYNPATGCLNFQLDSDAKVIRGLGELLLTQFNDITPSAISSFDLIQFFVELQLSQHLSESRTNGIKAIMDEIRAIALRYA